MKKDMTRVLIKRIIFKVIALVIISVIFGVLIQSPILTNSIAMGQMDNTNESYMIWQTYTHMTPIIDGCYGLIVLAVVIGIIRDVYRIIKIKKEGSR